MHFSHYVLNVSTPKLFPMFKPSPHCLLHLLSLFTKTRIWKFPLLKRFPSLLSVGTGLIFCIFPIPDGMGLYEWTAAEDWTQGKGCGKYRRTATPWEPDCSELTFTGAAGPPPTVLMGKTVSGEELEKSGEVAKPPHPRLTQVLTTETTLSTWEKEAAWRPDRRGRPGSREAPKPTPLPGGAGRQAPRVTPAARGGRSPGEGQGARSPLLPSPSPCLCRRRGDPCEPPRPASGSGAAVCLRGRLCVRRRAETWLLQNLFKGRWKPLPQLPGEALVPGEEEVAAARQREGAGAEEEQRPRRHKARERRRRRGGRAGCHQVGPSARRVQAAGLLRGWEGKLCWGAGGRACLSGEAPLKWNGTPQRGNRLGARRAPVLLLASPGDALPGSFATPGVRPQLRRGFGWGTGAHPRLPAPPPAFSPKPTFAGTASGRLGRGGGAAPLG